MNLLKLVVPEQKRWEWIYDKFDEEVHRPYLLCNEDGLKCFLQSLKKYVDSCYDSELPQGAIDSWIKEEARLGEVRFPFKRDGFLWRLLTLR